MARDSEGGQARSAKLDAGSGHREGGGVLLWIVKLAPHLFSGAGEHSVEIGCGADEREMGECLGKVSEELTVGTNFLGVETQVVGVAEELFEKKLRLLQFTGPCETFDVPERAGGETAFASG